MLYPSIEKISEFAETSSAIEHEYRDFAITDHRLAFEQALEFEVLDKQKILEIHYLLMMSIRPDIAGCIRNCNVYVGMRQCPFPELVPEMLDNWISKYGDANFTNGDPQEIKKAHVEFEKIHPFEDGNGRTGRIIMNWHFAKNNRNILIIEPGPDQFEYYTWFK